MTPDQWRRARDLFERALDEAPADVDAWLAMQLEDPAVAGEVRSLLAHHSRAGAFLQQPVLDRVPGLLPAAAHVKQAFQHKLIEHEDYVRRYGDDMPEIKNWVWPSRTPGTA